MNETTATDELIAEYGEWLKRESSVRNVGEWREVTLPFLDRSNDDLASTSAPPTESLVHRRRVHDGVSTSTASPSPNRDASASIVAPAFRRHGRR